MAFALGVCPWLAGFKLAVEPLGPAAFIAVVSAAFSMLGLGGLGLACAVAVDPWLAGFMLLLNLLGLASFVAGVSAAFSVLGWGSLGLACAAAVGPCGGRFLAAEGPAEPGTFFTTLLTTFFVVGADFDASAVLLGAGTDLFEWPLLGRLGPCWVLSLAWVGLLGSIAFLTTLLATFLGAAVLATAGSLVGAVLETWVLALLLVAAL